MKNFVFAMMAACSIFGASAQFAGDLAEFPQ